MSDVRGIVFKWMFLALITRRMKKPMYNKLDSVHGWCWTFHQF